jgi:hypothetical protein
MNLTLSKIYVEVVVVVVVDVIFVASNGAFDDGIRFRGDRDNGFASDVFATQLRTDARHAKHALQRIGFDDDDEEEE